MASVASPPVKVAAAAAASFVIWIPPSKEANPEAAKVVTPATAPTLARPCTLKSETPASRSKPPAVIVTPPVVAVIPAAAVSAPAEVIDIILVPKFAAEPAPL